MDLDLETSGRQQKAKARLVLLGFQDPKLTSVIRDAPTLSKEGRNTILQTIASCRWELTRFDIKTAFLRGKADENNPLAMEPPEELRKLLKLSQDQVCALVGNAYGRVDAPLLFYRELNRQMLSLDFKVHPLDPCIYYLESNKQGHRCLHGLVGTHVDDGLGAGESPTVDGAGSGDPEPPRPRTGQGAVTLNLCDTGAEPGGP